MDIDVSKIITEYKKLEPNGTDSWNILNSQHQYWHRYRLMFEVSKAIRKMNISADKIKVLDVGCGIGKSSRMLVELGILPHNITGVDVRPDAIETAKKISPNINFLCVDGLINWPDTYDFDLVMQCTVFSSIETIKDRKSLAVKMEKFVKTGYLFWWDLENANLFAGGDKLCPDEYFTKPRHKIFENKSSLRPTILESMRGVDRLYLGKYHYQLSTLGGLLSPLTHKSILYEFEK